MELHPSWKPSFAFGSRVSVGRRIRNPLPISLPRFDGPDFPENACDAVVAALSTTGTSCLTPYFRDSGRRRRRHIIPASLLLQQQQREVGIGVYSAREELEMHNAVLLYSSYEDFQRICRGKIDIPRAPVPNSRYIQRIS